MISSSPSSPDSIIVSFPKEQEIPLSICDATFGEFKFELPEYSIRNFYSLGPKNYSITYLDRDNTQKNAIKTRGFFWKKNAEKDRIDESCYQEFLTALLEENEEKKRLIPQFNINIEKKTAKLFSNLNLKTFSNNVYNKRVLYKKGVRNEYLVYSLPYGYDKRILEEAKKLSSHIKLT